MPKSEFNPLGTGQNGSIVELSDHHCICHILNPLLHNLSLLYPRGPKYSFSFTEAPVNIHDTPFHNSIQSNQGFLRTLQVPYQLWEWVIENIFTFYLFVIWQMGWKRGRVIADWTAAALGSHESKINTRSPNQLAIFQCFTNYTFLFFVCGSTFHGGKIGGNLPGDLREGLERVPVPI